MFRRILALLLVAGLSIVILRTTFPPQWRAMKQTLDLGHLEWTKLTSDDNSAVDVDPYAWREGKERGQFKEPKVDSKSPYPIGQTKTPGSNYTRTLVVPKLKAENTSWIEDELGDMLASGLLRTAMYVMDDPTAALRPIKNKGHEVMAYLSYVIDFYDDLPDIAIFMHAHRFAFHNNLILDEDSSQMVRHLSPERVTREGYMNLRCHWNPGCPDWMQPYEDDFTTEKREQQVLAASWAELFPHEPLPSILAQPCCGQFAVSRDRIRSIPKERFHSLREWLLHTDLDDFLSGRIFEYTWQYIFTASAFHCPSMSACYCDGYGICFGDAEKFDYYFELEHYRKAYTGELNLKNSSSRQGQSTQEMLDMPGPERKAWLREEVVRIEAEMEKRKREAIKRGKDPKQRALEAGRMWKDGDGF